MEQGSGVPAGYRYTLDPGILQSCASLRCITGTIRSSLHAVGGGEH